MRPTPKEIILGVARSITATMSPELQSPFAIAQAAAAAKVLNAAAEWIEAFPKHAAAETEDLKQTFDAIRPHGESAILEAAGFREAVDGGVRASDEDPPDHNGMASAMGELAGGVATGRIAGPVAAEVRGYLARHLERIRALLGDDSTLG